MTTSFKPNAFSEALKSVVGEHKTGWNTNDHLRFLDELLSGLVDSEGNPVELTLEQKELLQVAIAPTSSVQRSTIKRAFRDTQFELDDDAMGVLENVIGVQAFADFLAKEKNPDTGREYITKATKNGKTKALKGFLVATNVAAGAV